jgi:hypothetical protein
VAPKAKEHPNSLNLPTLISGNQSFQKLEGRSEDPGKSGNQKSKIGRNQSTLRNSAETLEKESKPFFDSMCPTLFLYLTLSLSIPLLREGIHTHNQNQGFDSFETTIWLNFGWQRVFRPPAYFDSFRRANRFRDRCHHSW